MLGGIVSCRHWWTVCSLLAQLMTLAFLVQSLFNITCSEAFIKNTFYCFQIVTYFVNIGWNEMKWIKFCFQLLLFQNKSWTSLWVLERKPERPNFRNSLWWMFFSLILFFGFSIWIPGMMAYLWADTSCNHRHEFGIQQNIRSNRLQGCMLNQNISETSFLRNTNCSHRVLVVLSSL